MMKLAILGYGIEGKSVEKYFKTHPYDNVPKEDIDITVFDNFNNEEIENLGLEKFDVIFRSPSVRPHYNFKRDDAASLNSEHLYEKDHPYWTSATKYFFKHCPAEIISVTGTKGKGTTCSMISEILKSIAKNLYKNRTDAPKTYLVGNIGNPCLDVLDKIKPHDNVVFELSSFQLWDLHENSYIGVILRIEPDHLNVHKDFEDYVYAKSAISRYKEKTDHLIYFKENQTTKSLAENSKAIKHEYPIKNGLSEKGKDRLKEVLDCLTLPGKHNLENAEAALLAVSARYCGGDLDKLLCLDEFYESIKTAFLNFKGLPHRLEFVRKLNGVKYYDDNFSSAYPATDVAISAFENYPTILIAGGKDRGLDLEKFKNRLKTAKNLKKIILIGEIAKKLQDETDEKYEVANDLKTAITLAKKSAEKYENSIVVMSPGAASFDMFENFKDRGEKFQKLVKELK